MTGRGVQSGRTCISVETGRADEPRWQRCLTRVDAWGDGRHRSIAVRIRDRMFVVTRKARVA